MRSLDYLEILPYFHKKVNGHIYIYFPTSLAPISHTVLNNWRFMVAKKGFAEQKPATAKCGGAKYRRGT